MTPALLLLAAALPSALSTSKLGPHLLGDPNDPGAQTVLAACPRVAKWLAGSGVPQSIASYRQSCPGGVVVLRVYVDGSTHYATSDDPVADADDFWSKLQGQLSSYPPSQIDWLEGPNELDNLPNWYQDEGAARWYASFIAHVADRMHAAGYHPLVGSIAVGNPALAGDLGAGTPCPMQYVADAMKQKGYTWGWSYHGYSQNLTQDVSQEIWLSLRYRTIRDQSGLQGVPLVLTEGGQDMPTGWQGRGTSASDYLGWLAWFDGQLQQDREVVGVTLFQIGNSTDWNNFNLDPIAAQLAAYLGGSASPVDAGGAAVASLSFSPGSPSAGDTLQVMVGAPQGFTYVALTGTDPSGAPTSQTGPAIAPAYSWTWTLDAPVVAGTYRFHFSCAEGATADASVVVAAGSRTSSSGSTGSSGSSTSSTGAGSSTGTSSSGRGTGSASGSSSGSSTSGASTTPTSRGVKGSGCSSGGGASALALLALSLLGCRRRTAGGRSRSAG